MGMLVCRNDRFMLESFRNLVRDDDGDTVILFSLSFICSNCFQVRDEVHGQFLIAI